MISLKVDKDLTFCSFGDKSYNLNNLVTFNQFKDIYNISLYNSALNINFTTHGGIYKLPDKLPNNAIKIRFYGQNSNNSMDYINTKLGKLPDNTTFLTISGFKNLIEIPTLPDKLQFLNLSYCSISSLPEFTYNMTYININNLHNLTSLPELPPYLVGLICKNTSIIELPELPNSLETIDCSNNKIIKLPNKLPSNLELLNCGNNKLKYLPDTLGDFIIYADNNELVDIPESYLKYTGHPMVKPGYSFDNNPVNDMIEKYFKYGKQGWLYELKNYIEFRKKYQKKFVLKIENWFLNCKYNPKFKYCRNMLKKDYDNLYSHEN